MNVFVTGGTGLVGSAAVSELIAHGHEVTALVRSDASARAVEQSGATPLRGELADLDLLRRAADRAEGVLHLAFRNDFSSPQAIADSVREEAAALQTFGEALTGSDRPLVTVAGTPRVAGRPSTETDPLNIEGPTGGRAQSVNDVLGLAASGVRGAAVRLPRTVHRDGTGGFAGILTQFARQSGIAGYPGDGTQRWPAVHALDAAALFRLVLEKAEPGTSWHAVADEGDAVADMAEVIGRRLGVPTGPQPMEAFGTLGAIFAADQPSSSALTRATLGWTPTHPSLLEDLELVRP